MDNPLAYFSSEMNLLIFLVKLAIGYCCLIAFIKSINQPIFDIHNTFLSRPEILLMAGGAIVYQSTGNPSIAIYSVILYYVTSIAANNITETYDLAFGYLSPFFKNISQSLGFLEVDEIFDIDEDLNLDLDLDFI